MKISCLKKLVLTVLFAAIICSACSKKNEAATTDDAIPLELRSAGTEDARELFGQDIQLWHATNKRVCVVLGYNFNSPATVASLSAVLENHYGLDADGGLVYPLVYPDDFKHGGKAYVSDLTAILNDPGMDFAGVIILGAPEGTHLALARMQDFWEMNVPYPVFVLFPQDDVLGLESTADFVLDKSHSAEFVEEHTAEAEDKEFLSASTDIAIRSIDYMLANEAPLPKTQALQQHIEQLLDGYSFRHYVDPETSIQAVNHFILN